MTVVLQPELRRSSSFIREHKSADQHGETETETEREVEHEEGESRTCVCRHMAWQKHVQVPVVDLTSANAAAQAVRACEEYGVFKVVNHGVPRWVVEAMAEQSRQLFDLPLPLKMRAGPTDPFGYGNRFIGPNGDVGWIEYLLLPCNSTSIRSRLASLLPDLDLHAHAAFCDVVEEYIAQTRELACRILEVLAEGLHLDKHTFSRYVRAADSDSAFRLNHYPPCPRPDMHLGFGEHSDPQIVTLLRSNDVCGLQFQTPDGSWATVAPDDANANASASRDSFAVNVGDCLHVLSNGRFNSVWHRALPNRCRSRYSTMFFAAPALDAVVRPPPELHPYSHSHPEAPLFQEFSWRQYKHALYGTSLGRRPRLLDSFRLP